MTQVRWEADWLSCESELAVGHEIGLTGSSASRSAWLVSSRAGLYWPWARSSAPDTVRLALCLLTETFFLCLTFSGQDPLASLELNCCPRIFSTVARLESHGENLCCLMYTFMLCLTSQRCILLAFGAAWVCGVL